MASARKNHRRRRGRSRLGFLFKLLCIGGVVVALTMGATVFFRVESVVVKLMVLEVATFPALSVVCTLHVTVPLSGS